MILHDHCVPALARPVDPLLAGSLTAASRWGGRGDFFDVLRREVKEFRVGIACYRLRSPLLATFYPRIDGQAGRLTVTSAWLAIVGCGASLDEAWQDWADQLHVRFQTLLAKRAWEMDPAEVADWGRIERMVDVAAYRRETPQFVRQIGWLTRRRPIPDRVRWEDGRQERVLLAQMPPEFAALHEGHRFEAEVERHPLTGRLIRAVVVRPLPPLRPGSADEVVWSSLPTTANDPAVAWDEFE